MRTSIVAVHTMIALSFIVVGTPQLFAGVVLDSNGIVTKWTTENGSNTDYYFYEGSYNDVASVATVFTPTNNAANIGGDLTNLASALQSNGASNDGVIYVFAYDDGAHDPGDIGGYAVVKWAVINSWTTNDTNDRNRTATTIDAFGFGAATIYWASTTAPSNGTVPEPSTAIAMGLLGVVGFAGNRRRRR